MTTMWKKIMLILFVLTLPLPHLYSQEKSFLWKIEYQGKASYLLGSVHVLKQEHYPLKASIEDAFAQTDVLAVEANITDPKAMAVGLKMMQMGMYTGDDTLEKNISPKTFKFLEDKLEKMGMKVATFEKFKPWMAAMFILQTELGKMGFDPKWGVDAHFLAKATTDNKEVVELEGVEFQMNLVNSFNLKESEAFLLSTILEIDQLKTELDKMISSWLSGDINSMDQLLKGYTKTSPEVEALYRKMNDDRNVGMVQKVESYLKSGKQYFVIAGAAHMIGPNGIVQTLKNKGYTITQI